MVATTPPLSCQPSNGVFFDFDLSAARANRDRHVGRQDRDVGAAAFAPAMPPGTLNTRAGLTDSSSISA